VTHSWQIAKVVPLAPELLDALVPDPPMPATGTSPRICTHDAAAAKIETAKSTAPNERAGDRIRTSP
jgi:hypothetical protein